MGAALRLLVTLNGPRRAKNRPAWGRLSSLGDERGVKTGGSKNISPVTLPFDVHLSILGRIDQIQVIPAPSMMMSFLSSCMPLVRMSAIGYERTFSRLVIYVRFTPESGHKQRVRLMSANDPKRTLRQAALDVCK